MRVDACIFAHGQVSSVLTFDSENMLAFEPLAIVWGDGLESTCTLHLDACELRFAPPEDGDLAPLVAWFRRWFDEATIAPRPTSSPAVSRTRSRGPKRKATTGC